MIRLEVTLQECPCCSQRCSMCCLYSLPRELGPVMTPFYRWAKGGSSPQLGRSRVLRGTSGTGLSRGTLDLSSVQGQSQRQGGKEK